MSTPYCSSFGMSPVGVAGVAMAMAGAGKIRKVDQLSLINVAMRCMEDAGWVTSLGPEAIEILQGPKVEKMAPAVHARVRALLDGSVGWVELKDGSLDTTLRVENLSSEPFDFTLALHSYYSCSKVDDLAIEGPFLGKTKLDKTQDPPAITAADSDVVKIGAFTEEIYRNVLPGSCRLTDPAKGTLEIVNDGGWKDVVVWNPYGDAGMGYEGFVCCESAGLTPVDLAPKETWDATMRLVATPK